MKAGFQTRFKAYLSQTEPLAVTFLFGRNDRHCTADNVNTGNYPTGAHFHDRCIHTVALIFALNAGSRQALERRKEAEIAFAIVASDRDGTLIIRLCLEVQSARPRKLFVHLSESVGPNFVAQPR